MPDAGAVAGQDGANGHGVGCRHGPNAYRVLWARNRRIFDLWLACWTLEEIAAATDASKSDVDRVVSSFSQNGESSILGKTELASADHATDFTPPKFVQERQVALLHKPGQIPPPVHF